MSRQTSPIARFVWSDHVADSSYDYELFIDRKGIVLIGRYDKAGTNARFLIKKYHNQTSYKQSTFPKLHAMIRLTST